MRGVSGEPGAEKASEAQMSLFLVMRGFILTRQAWFKGPSVALLEIQGFGRYLGLVTHHRTSSIKEAKYVPLLLFDKLYCIFKNIFFY